MAKIVWDAVGQKLYKAGVDHTVLYVVSSDGEYTPGVPWNGITSIAENPEGGEPNDQYADNIKYLSIMSTEKLNGSIGALFYPPEWNACDGNVELAKGVTIGQQDRKTFGLCYRTKIGNDVDGEDHGYELHLIYGAKASPSERTHETINDSPDAAEFSWDYNTTPVPVEGHKPTASLTIDSTTVDKEKLAALEAILYGTNADNTDTENPVAATEPRLPLPDEVYQILSGNMAAAYSARMRNTVVR